MYKVFLVDDEPFIIEGLYDIVDWAQLGMEIVGQAENGKAALQALHEKPVDILITDISMPEMTGLQLIREARKFKPALKVIVLSGYDEFAYLKEGMALGIENYLLKPINLEEFRGTLASVRDKLEVSRSNEALNEYSIRILRDNVMHRWVYNQIGTLEFKERADLLGIDIDKPLVLISLLRFRLNSTGAFDLVERELSGDPSVIPFRNNDSDIVLLHHFEDSGQGKQEVQARIDRLTSILSSFQPQISLGSVENRDTGASLSYENAKKAQEYFMIFPEKNVISYDELNARSATTAEASSFDWNESSRLLLARDKEGLFALIDRQFTSLGESGAASPALLQEVALEWMIRIKLELQEIRHSEDVGLFSGGFEQIQSATTVEELAAIVKQTAAAVMEAMTRDVKSPVVQQVLNTIQNSYNQDLSLKTLANTYKIHPVYLGQLFHKEVGESFTEYINRYRIDKAKEMLKTTHQKVHEIARNVGYWETGYFYKQFKRYVGVSPTEFKGLG
ncbi:response regulator transcription factor [Paenibacillus sp. Marseille-P2973]|uniref:response regulator transcription factor n=1 Tax=Paenibacillus sp. Marseille-P2973 TaxID=1871032 RepID=UPI001B3738E2|nr:response regulator transcription factor [Paenibacillus sp. Marseille-P2973]MBQ4899704.1 response regulator transcription factor [Paenibacillus sp. Marseille-P2973]